MKSTLILAAGCLVAALAVGDTVYRISPRPGLTYPAEAVAQASVGDISELTDEDEVRLGIQVAESTSDDATFYLSRSEAARLALMIGKASLDDAP